MREATDNISWRWWSVRARHYKTNSPGQSSSWLKVWRHWRNWIYTYIAKVKRFWSWKSFNKQATIAEIEMEGEETPSERAPPAAKMEGEEMPSESAPPAAKAESGKGWNGYLKRWRGSSVSRTPPDRPAAGSRQHSARLPRELPTWAPGTGFATGKLNLGEISLIRIATFEQAWNSGIGDTGASFYNPVNLPEGYSSFGSYAQLNVVPERGWVLAVSGSFEGSSPPLAKPTDYTLVWASADWAEVEQDVLAFFWAPVVPSGYKALGFVVTDSPEKPQKDDIVLVREDLTEESVVDQALWNSSELEGVPPFSVWNTKPAVVGVAATGIPVNTMYCNTAVTYEVPLSTVCLKNVNRVLDLMPTLEQLEQVLKTFGPTVFFHPEEEYLPTTAQWFFDKGALFYTATSPNSPVRIETGGANLPPGGDGNDGAYWLDLPADGTRDTIRKGDISAAKVLVHAKPMFGGILTDVSCWIFHCFNGSSIAKVGILKALSLGKIGEHVGDWEHFVVRIDNFSGELRRVYLGEHAAGTWYRPDELEFVDENRVVVYSAKGSHALYHKEGNNLQGDEKLGVGIRNDTSKSTLMIDSSTQYEFINVEYLGEKGETDYPKQPPWVEYMRQWGPTVTYDSKTELQKIISYLPKLLRKSVLDLLSKLPLELGGEVGPTGPKEKGSWFGDEREF